MASTNKTTHYELSQYVANDKPTYLVDYNQDMQKIDAGIYSAESKATVNTGAIGDLTDLDTTAKSDLVSAINEVNTQVTTNTGNISTNTSNISTLGTNQGVMANLTTTDKTSLVNAVNEVNAVNGTQQTAIDKNTNDIADLISFISLVDYQTVNNSNITCNYATINNNGTKVRFAYNQDKTVFKIYGRIMLYPINNQSTDWKVTLPSELRPNEEYTIQNAGLLINQANSYLPNQQYPLGGSASVDIKVKTDGTIELTSSDNQSLSRSSWIYLTPCLYFNSNFGD